MSDRALERRVRARLDAWRGSGLLRTLQPPSGIDLSSNDYLNLASDPRLTERFAEAAREGCGSTGSRLLRGEREAFAALERRFAAFKRTERSLYFSSGYLANIGLLTALAEPGDLVASDERNHASLIDAIRLSPARRVVFRHNDVEALERALRTTPCEGHRFVVTESLFSMDGDIAPLTEYAAICRRMDAALIVDEAHAVGVYGERGSGLVEALGVEADVTASVSTAGKALGVSGAFVAGPAWVIEYLVQRARPFVFSTAAPPPVAAALDASLDIVSGEPERRQRLLARAAHLRARLSSSNLLNPLNPLNPLNLSPSPIIPVVIGDNRAAVAASMALRSRGFDVRAIRWPSVPEGTARLRISVNAGLSESTLDRFADALAGVLKEIGVCSVASS